ncbi:MAG: HAD hydrolase-like protein [Oscillospiraceae bacterium]|nr:HAD hydrolase-like protein [Oscillospiraceae bacterium]
MYSNVIWDWNGTLFDDVDWCIEVLNSMLSKRGLKTVAGVREYHAVFCFPVIDYYRKVGFDFNKEPFEVLAAEFIEKYHSNDRNRCTLFAGASEILSEINDLGIPQVILSASKMNLLEIQIDYFDIKGNFVELLGLSDFYAASKINVGLDYIKRQNITHAVLIGDTKHDYEAAEALGIDCILIPNGHQSRETLLSCGVPVLNSIMDVPGFITG